MTLLDFTPANLDFARRQIRRQKLQAKVHGVVEGSIVDLSMFPDQAFDAVICTGGPLSHVLDAADRNRAVSELVRVAKPGAPIFISVMSRLSILLVIFNLFPHELEMPHFRPLRDSGDYAGEYGFTACHFFLPEEFLAIFADQPVTVLELAGLEGISSHFRRRLNKLARDEVRWKIWLETHFATCTHLGVVGTSEHMLAVCRKI
jgi:SAM-dependent methyltransferase